MDHFVVVVDETGCRHIGVGSQTADGAFGACSLHLDMGRCDAALSHRRLLDRQFRVLA